MKNGGMQNGGGGRIVVPFGRPVVRVTVDMDVKGAIRVDAAREVMGKAAPMSQVAALAFLSQAVAGGLAGLVDVRPVVMGGVEGGDDGDKTGGEAS